ncbi:MAG: glycosyl hydrolase [Planctomyces sp.]
MLKTARCRLLLPILLLIACTLPAAQAQQVAHAESGSGSWLIGLPPNCNGPPTKIYRSPQLQGPMPTNDWWSSLAWVPLSEPMYPHPLAVQTVPQGLQIAWPGPGITANQAAIFGHIGAPGSDLILGHSEVTAFPEAVVESFSDWFVTARMQQGQHSLLLTFGHGSPFVYAICEGGNPTISFNKPPQIETTDLPAHVVVVKSNNRRYALIAPTGSRWTGLDTQRFTAETSGTSWFTVASIPDDQPESLQLLLRYAGTHVVNSQVAWQYLPETNEVCTTFEVTTRIHEGTESGTLLCLYPHQWRHTSAPLTSLQYSSIRGPMKVLQGNRFETRHKLPPLLPALPLLTDAARREIVPLLKADLAAEPLLKGDTYWLGKQLGKWATLLPLAEQAGQPELTAECTRRLRTVLEDFLTAHDASGQPAQPAEALFAWDPNWGTLIGLPASYGSDDQLNDHHFHYGYFLHAAARLSLQDPAWGQRWKQSLMLLIRDIAATDRNDPMFPFLRCFDPWAGHSWASGHARFGDGNNIESSSEAINAWFGILLLGEALHDQQLRDLGAWLLAVETAAIDDYWFDVHDELFPDTWPASVVTMVWGGKGANGTWFSDNPEEVHGINFLPFTSASLYLGRHPAYPPKNFAALIRENAARDGNDGRQFDRWADLMWMYRALSDPQDAAQMRQKRPADFQYEAGNSQAATFAWISLLQQLGTPDCSETADSPWTATFHDGNTRSRIVWNLTQQPQTVRFSAGQQITAPPGNFLLLNAE